MAGSETFRVLVVDGSPGLIGDYARTLVPQDGDRIADLELMTCSTNDAAAEALGLGLREGRPFAIVFIDPQGKQSKDALAALARIRALDGELHIVVVTARPDLQPCELSTRVAPADKLYYLQKPFHGAEIQQLALALTAKWRAGRASATAAEPVVGATLDHHPAGVLVFDGEDRLRAANRSMFGLFPELENRLDPGTSYGEVQRLMAAHLLPDDVLYRTQAWVRDRLRWHGAGGGVLEQKLRGGRWVLLAEVRDESGITTCHFTDITDLKRREAERNNAARMAQMAQAFGGLCDRFFHEPGALEAQSGDGKVVSLRPRSAGTAKRQQPKGHEAEVHSLAEKLRAVAQRQKLEPDAIDLNRAVAETLRQSAGLLPGTIEIEIVRGGGLWPVLIDQEKLSLALRELVANACEAMIGRGRLTVETANVRAAKEAASARSRRPAGDYVRLSVRDEGPGMSPELAERALNPFFSAKGKDAHLGLGLSVVHGFARQSGGSLEIAEAESGGASVDLYFPRSRAAARSVAPAGRPRRKGRD